MKSNYLIHFTNHELLTLIRCIDAQCQEDRDLLQYLSNSERQALERKLKEEEKLLLRLQLKLEKGTH